jgi:uncharacterized membrane protein
MLPMHHPNKKEFQVERLIFFSDAVFAIAITLLVIEMRVPVLKEGEVTEAGFKQALIHLLPGFLGFFFSFFIIGLYWYIHHRMFGYVINYTPGLIWLNLLFLFSVALIPFSTAVYSEYSTPDRVHLHTPYLIYVANMTLTGTLNFMLWNYIGNPSNNVSECLPGGDFLKKARIRSLAIPVMFVLSYVAVRYWNPGYGRFVLCLIPLVMAMIRNKKTKPVPSN